MRSPRPIGSAALMAALTLPDGKLPSPVPRDKVGDRKGHFPSPNQSTGKRKRTINLASRSIKIKQGKAERLKDGTLSSNAEVQANWDTFGAKGGKGRKVSRKRKMQLANSPTLQGSVITNARYDTQTKRIIRTAAPRGKVAKPYAVLMAQVRKAKKRRVNPYYTEAELDRMPLRKQLKLGRWS